MICRGIRGAICVTANEADAILEGTRELLQRIVTANGVSVEDVASVIFTVTPDLDAAFPAQAAREMGWLNTPLLCMQEIPVARGLPRCIRVLLHWNTDLPPNQIQHIYVDRASALRPDLVEVLS